MAPCNDLEETGNGQRIAAQEGDLLSFIDAEIHFIEQFPSIHTFAQVLYVQVSGYPLHAMAGK
jgi:hypothetical protein